MHCNNLWFILDGKYYIVSKYEKKNISIDFHDIDIWSVLKL